MVARTCPGAAFVIAMTREEALRSMHEQVFVLLFNRDDTEALRKLDDATKEITRHVVEIYARRVKKGNRE